MSNERFKELDESWMRDLKNLREEKISPERLKGFSASVRARILEEETKKALRTRPNPFRWLLPVWVPTLAVLVIASAVVLKSPAGQTPYAPSAKTSHVASANVSEVSEEIEALRQVGAWSEDDEDEVAGEIAIL